MMLRRICILLGMGAVILMMIVGCSSNPVAPSANGTDLALKSTPQITEYDRENGDEPDQQDPIPATENELLAEDITR